MGGNGSKSSGSLEKEEGRRWKTVAVLPNGVKIIELKNPKTALKQPEESHTPNSIYGMMYYDGSSLKSLAVFDSECKKVVEIHTNDHKGLGVHYHVWENGRPISIHPISDNPKWEKLLNETLSYL